MTSRVRRRAADGSGRGPAATIDRTTGTNIGDMTVGGGLAGAFDGTTNQAATSGAQLNSTQNAYVGKTTAVPTAIESVRVFGSNNNGYVNTVDPTVTLTLFGKNGSAPANSADGTSIGSINFTDTSNESTGRDITSSDTATYWDHVWVRITISGGTNRTVNIAELQMTGWI